MTKFAWDSSSIGAITGARAVCVRGITGCKETVCSLKALFYQETATSAFLYPNSLAMVFSNTLIISFVGFRMFAV